MDLTREQIEAMEAGRELDGEISQALFGWVPPGIGTSDWRDERGSRRPCPLSYSTDIASAWRVVEANSVSGYLVLEEAPTDDRWRATFWFSAEDSVSAYGDTAPLAICRASLLALLRDRQAGGKE